MIAPLHPSGDTSQGALTLSQILNSLAAHPDKDNVLAAAALLPNVDMEGLHDALRRLSSAIVRLLDGDLQQPVAFFNELLSRSDFKRTEPIGRLSLIHDELLLPVMRKALEQGAYDLGFFLLGKAYLKYVKADETEAHFARVVKTWREPFAAAAHRFRADMGDTAARALPNLATLQKPYKVVFIVDTGARLAHIDAMLSMLKGYRAQKYQPFVPIVAVLDGTPKWEHELAEMGVGLIDLPRKLPKVGITTRAWALRDWMQRNDVIAAVQVSVVAYMPFLFNLPLAPVQIWWAMKYHAYELPVIDGYVTGGASMGRFATIDGRVWRSGRPGYAGLVSPEKKNAAADLRKSFPPDAILLATLAREEKLNRPEYLSAVGTILRENPKAHFLWSGRMRPPSIDAAFTLAGVQDRVHYVGWVDTVLYAQVFDIFLDSFPACCGLTLYQAMAAGKPFVLFDSMESRSAGLSCFITPVLEGVDGTPEEQADIKAVFSDQAGNSLYFLAKAAEDYVAKASTLIRDPALRAKAGNAARRYAEKYLGNPVTMGVSYAQHFDEVVREKLSGLGQSGA